VNWLTHLFRPHVELPPGLAPRVETWREVDQPRDSTSLLAARFVVVDVETSGLDTRKDRLLSIGACVVQNQRLMMGEHYSTILCRTESNTRENILIHGIGPQAQAAGQPTEESVMGFLEFAGKFPLIGYHAGFDKAFLDRELRHTLGVRLPNTWIDLAMLAPVLVPEAKLAAAGLDDWLGYFHLRPHARHQALDDAVATGELFLVLLKRALTLGYATVDALVTAAADHQRLLQGSHSGGV